jgi:mitochondrial import inner membrane translocase subunit TIM9
MKRKSKIKNKFYSINFSKSMKNIFCKIEVTKTNHNTDKKSEKMNRGGYGNFQQNQNYQQMQQMKQAQEMQMMQELQMKEQMNNFTFILNTCFSECVNKFDSKELDDKEKVCLNKCSAKMIGSIQRVGEIFAQNQELFQKK